MSTKATRHFDLFLILALAFFFTVSSPAYATSITSIEPTQISATKTGALTITLDKPAPLANVRLEPGGPYLIKEIPFETIIVDAAFTSDSAYLLNQQQELQIVPFSTVDSLIANTLSVPEKRAYKRIVLNDDLGLIGDDQGLFFIWDISKDTAIKALNRWSLTANLKDIAIDKQHIAVLLDSGTLLLFRLDPSSPLELLGQYDGLSGAHHLAFKNNTIYIAHGNTGIVVLDSSDPKNIKRITRYATSAPALDIKTANNFVYVAAGQGGLIILDITNPQEILWRGSHRQLGFVDRIVVNEDHLLAINQAGHVFVLDVGEPTFPTILTSFRINTHIVNATLLTDKAVIITDNSLQLWDIKAGPVFSNENFNIGEGVNYGGQRKAFLDSIKKRLYVADWFSGIHIYGIAQPAAPVLLSSYATPGSSKGIVVQDDIAFIADDDHGLRVVDVSQPEDPQPIAELLTTGLAYTPIIEGQRLFLASHRGGIQIIDISSVHDPKVISEFDTPNKAWSIAVKQNIAFVADAESGLLVVDVSDPLKPKLIGQFNPQGNAEDVLIEGDVAYVAFYDQGLYILDISDPSQPTLLSHNPTPGNARGLAKQGDRIYIADWLAGIHIFDVGNPEKPLLLGSYDTDGAAWGVRIMEDYAFVLDWWGGLSVLNIADPRKPVLAGNYNQSDTVQHIAAYTDYIFAAQGTHGLQIYDIKNPLNPTWITGLGLNGYANSVTIKNSIAYVTTNEGGLSIVDINDAFQPKRIAHLATAMPVNQVQVDGNTAYLKTRDGNIILVDISDPYEPRQQHLLFVEAKDYIVKDAMLYALSSNGDVQGLSITNETTHLLWKTSLTHHAELLAANSKFVYIFHQNQGVVIYSKSPQGLTKVATFPFQGNVIDMMIENNDLLLLDKSQGIIVIDITDTAQLHIKNQYRLTSQLTRLTKHRNHIYGAGENKIIATVMQPTVETQTISNKKYMLTFQNPLLVGYYNVVVSPSEGTNTVLSNGLEVVGPLFMKPTKTIEEIEQLNQPAEKIHPPSKGQEE